MGRHLPNMGNLKGSDQHTSVQTRGALQSRFVTEGFGQANGFFRKQLLIFIHVQRHADHLGRGHADMNNPRLTAIVFWVGCQH